jgi:hypothetical protein
MEYGSRKRDCKQKVVEIMKRSPVPAVRVMASEMLLSASLESSAEDFLSDLKLVLTFLMAELVFLNELAEDLELSGSTIGATISQTGIPIIEFRGFVSAKTASELLMS